MTLEQLTDFHKKINGTKFFKDLDASININDTDMPLGMWNLLLTIRDVKLHSVGIKPCRGWKFGEVKKYYGVKGNAESVLEQLQYYKQCLTK